MDERRSKTPHLSQQGKQARDRREARLAEALRDNLRKRKEQARGRKGAGAAGAQQGEANPEPEPGDDRRGGA